MKIDVLLGLQWGDEGKGKIVDVLTPGYDVVARFQGGPNAGHTLEFGGHKYVLRSVPSGIFQNKSINIIGNGVVLDPALFKEEVEALEASGHDLKRRLLISKKAHLILPTHRLLDACYEQAKGESKIGTTGKGIGPAYAEKIGRSGLRVGDILHNFDEKYDLLKAKHMQILQQYRFNASALPEMEKTWLEGLKKLQEFEFVDSEYYLNQALQDNRKVLAEGAQGTMLDIDFGSYPFVTSSNTIAAGACIGLGVSPQNVGDVYGIFKAYCTRVGSGPFPTELHDETGDELRKRGFEFGSVTGRPRRCGWLDLVALRYAVMLDGVTQLIMMKSDVLDTFSKIKICVAYEINGKRTTEIPFDLGEGVTPVYEEFAGWQTDMSGMRKETEFPVQFSHYLQFIEKYVGIPIKVISLGPDREQTIIRK